MLMDSIASRLHSITGAPEDQIKVFIFFTLNYPLGHLYIRIPNELPALRHIFSIFISLYALLELKLYSGIAHELFSISGVWVLLRWKHKYMPWAVFFFAMVHLMYNHLYRIWFHLSVENFDITFSQMVLVMKITTLAWNIHDGRQPDEFLDQQQKESRVVQFPSLLEYLGYCFYFPGFLVGPSCDFHTYRALCSGTLYTPREGKAVPAVTVLEGRKRSAYYHMAIGAVNIVIWLTCNSRVNYFQVMQEGWEKQAFVKRVFLVQLMGIVQRTKYYGAWKLSEGAAILTGLGFNGYTRDGKTLWNRATNVNILNVEFAPNIKLLLDNWNVNTNVWLRHCVYKRVTPRGKKPGFRSSMLTFLVSALWHGSESGYYLTFIQGGFVQTVARMMRSCVRPFLLPPVVEIRRATTDTEPSTRAATPAPEDGVSPVPGTPISGVPGSSGGKVFVPPPPPPTLIKRIYDILGMICTSMELNYCAAPFILLTAKNSLLGWGKMGWYGTWMSFVPLLFFWLGGRPFLLGKLKQRAEKEKRRLERIEHLPGVVVVPPSPVITKADEVEEFVDQGWTATKLD
ncbi:MBOAT-domain-containing protein [Dacryopinax primogenitus]|uniref:MBOAT-domain-containing protein n=1 Tax=Dacryopinax primogenitus (strain DJM 731) TaxID=1858805 RepID=M5GBW4_DACPD|nr:MBOAT-domain-containing protein [Dacryopinax primogenitus]EJU06489.1 MBOAT-domain-containing protein [Dacryopinax primogenitus]